MSEFDKLKIGFVLALLATVFAVHPIVQEYRSLGYSLWALDFTIWRLYVALSAILSLAVYLYAINIVKERPFSLIQIAGNVAYAASLLAVPAFLLLWLATYVGLIIGELLEHRRIGDLIEKVLPLIALLSVLQSSYQFYRVVRKKTKASTVSALTGEEAGRIRRAHQMLEAGHYDLAIMDAYGAVETAMRRGLTELGVLPSRQGLVGMIGQSIGKKVIPADARGALLEIHKARNSAAHSAEPIDAESAKAIVDLANRVLAMVKHDSAEKED